MTLAARSTPSVVDIDVIGTTTIRVDGVEVPLLRRQIRQLVCALVVRPGSVVSVDALIDHLWPDKLPARPRKALNVALSRLRAALGPAADVLVAEGDGYRLDGVTVDIERFTALVDLGRQRVGSEACDALGGALEMWNATPFADDLDAPLLDGRRASLDEQWWYALTRRCELLVELGQHEAAVALTAPHVFDHVIRERLVIAHARALARSGRKSDALDVANQVILRLRTSTGLEPSAALLAATDEIRLGDVDLESFGSPRRRPDSAVFVGRVEELAALGRAAPGHAVAVIGEAGAGKSALIDRFVVERQRQGERVVRIDVSPTPERPMDSAARICLAVIESGQLDSIESEFRAAAKRLCPEFVGEVSSSLTRDSLIDDVVRLVESRCGDTTVVIDDAHWLDGGSAEVIEQLVRRGRVALVLGLRPTDHTDLSFVIESSAHDDGRCESFELDPLSRADVTELLNRSTQRVVSAPDVEKMLSQSGGNALFLRLLIDRWIDGVSPGGALPSDVLVAVAERLDELARHVRDTLDVAAVVGTTFDVHVLRRLRPNADVDLDAAVVAGVVVIDHLADQGTFSHALVAEVCRQLMATGRRTSVHDALGRSLEFDGAPASELAPHYLAAASLDPLRAITTSLSAAAHFAVGFDWQVARRHLDAARRTALDHGIVDHEVLAQIHIRSGTVERALGMAEYVSDLLSGCELARAAGNDDLFVVGVAELCGHGATTAVGLVDERVSELLDEALELDISDPVRAELCAAAVPLFATSTDALRGRALYREGWELSQRLGDVEVEAAVVTHAHLGFSHPDDFDLLVHAAARLGELAGSNAEMTWESAFIRFQCSVVVGDVDGAQRAMSEMRRSATHVARRSRDFGMAFSESAYAMLRGDLDEAESRAEHALQVGLERFDASWAMTVHAVMLAEVRRAQGRLAELSDYAEAAVGSQPTYAPFRSFASLIALNAGDEARARGHLDVLTEHRFASVVPDLAFTAVLAVAAPAVAALGSADERLTLHEMLSPFTGRMSWNGASSSGPIDGALAALERSMGDQEAAALHEAAAIRLVDSFKI